MNIVTVILAGGKSSRMGTDKALLDIHGKPLLTIIYTIVSQCTNKVYVVTPWVEKYRSILPPECEFIEESSPFQGGLMAFAQALNYIEADWIFLLACDLPFLTLTEVKEWINYLPNIEDHSIAFLAKNDKGWECLCGFYRYSCKKSLLESISLGNKSFQRWLNKEKVTELKIKNKEIFFNCNNIKDYQKVLNKNY